MEARFVFVFYITLDFKILLEFKQNYFKSTLKEKKNIKTNCGRKRKAISQSAQKFKNTN